MAPHERYGLIAQVRRAAFSIAANIAEGASKRGPREFRRYLDMAWGSFGELRYSLRLAHDLGYADHFAWDALQKECEIAGKLLWGLYRSISRAAHR